MCVCVTIYNMYICDFFISESNQVQMDLQSRARKLPQSLKLVYIKNTMSTLEKVSAVIEVGELYVQVNMGFSPSRISFLLHLLGDYFVS